MTFPFYFLLCNAVLAVLLGLLLLCRYLGRKHISISSRYLVWYLFVLALVLPFVPWSTSGPASFLIRLSQFFSPHTAAGSSEMLSQTGSAAPSGQTVVSDLGVSMNSSASASLSRWIWGIWLAGCCIAALYFAYNIFRIHLIKKTACAVTTENEPELYACYQSCCRELGIKRRVGLYASCRISSPVSYGILFPKVMIPQDMDILLGEEEVRFIFLHELQHYRRRDAVLNYAACLFQIIYWFNPLIWYGFRLMRKDREIACDHSVIRTVGREQAAAYGFTLIHYAEKLRQGAFLSPLSYLGEEKAVIFRRIQEIADYREDTRTQKVRGVCFLLLAAVLVYTASPLLTAYAASNSPYSLAGKHVESIDLSSYFPEGEGTFVLYDTTTDQYKIYNEDMSTKRVSPDSTFKIYSGLFALEEGIITPESSGLSWDGTEYSIGSWNSDQTLSSAMQNSVNWYFQDLDRSLGSASLYSYYSRIAYGNCDLTGGVDNYWAESSLKISPVEQTELLSGLLENTWGFGEENIQAVKDAMFLAESDAGKLYGKTGTGATADGENINGWFVGFLESEDHVYSFALRLWDSPLADGNTASRIAMNILNDILS